MKRLLPHLFYLTLIIGLGIFFWLRLRAENQWIALLNRPTDEVYISIRWVNREIKHDVERLIEAYPNERYMEIGRRMSIADSLLTISYSNPAKRDSLPSWLWALTDSNPELAPVFQVLLPPKNYSTFPYAYQQMLEQNDSVRKQLTNLVLLDYCSERTLGLYCGIYDSYQPAVSFTTLCPKVCAPFEMDILLKEYPTQSYDAHISVDGQMLLMKEGIAHLERTFPKPGVYPLQVKAECPHFFDMDSSLAIKKTFYFHVSQ